MNTSRREKSIQWIRNESQVNFRSQTLGLMGWVGTPSLPLTSWGKLFTSVKKYFQAW
jgi:hypothetical protein